MRQQCCPRCCLTMHEVSRWFANVIPRFCLRPFGGGATQPLRRTAAQFTLFYIVLHFTLYEDSNLVDFLHHSPDALGAERRGGGGGHLQDTRHEC